MCEIELSQSWMQNFTICKNPDILSRHSLGSDLAANIITGLKTCWVVKIIRHVLNDLYDIGLLHISEKGHNLEPTY